MDYSTQDFPSLSLVCPWTIVLSSPFLSLSLSFLLSFLSSPSSLGVPGCFRHSWEPFLFGVSFLARGVFTSKLGFCKKF